MVLVGETSFFVNFAIVTIFLAVVTGRPRREPDLTRNTRAPHFTPQHWLLCHKGLYSFEFEFENFAT